MPDEEELREMIEDAIEKHEKFVPLVKEERESECELCQRCREIESIAGMWEGERNCSEEYHVFCETALALFEPEAVKIDFSTYREEGGERETEETGTIWYSDGSLFVKHELVSDDSDTEVLNYATVDGKLYEWNPATGEGESLKRYDGDAAEFLMYFIAVSYTHLTLPTN